MNNKKNNKGFSLVELIVVVAIMAVLVGVLAPAYLRYVENSRVQKDVSAVGEVIQAIKLAAANEDVASNINDGDVTVTVNDESAPTTSETADANGDKALEDELAASIGEVDLTSKSLDGGDVSITVGMGDNNALEISVTSDDLDEDKDADILEKLEALSENVSAAGDGDGEG